MKAVVARFGAFLSFFWRFFLSFPGFSDSAFLF
jgi:hypothetical protein